MNSSRSLALVSLFAALLAVFGLIPKIDLPLGVPITLQTLGVMLAGCLLAPLVMPPAAALLVFCIGMAVISPIQAVVFTYPSARFEGLALAAGLGFLNGLGVTGGFVGPYIMGAIEQATGKPSTGLLFMAAAVAIAGVASFGLRYPAQDRVKA